MPIVEIHLKPGREAMAERPSAAPEIAAAATCRTARRGLGDHPHELIGAVGTSEDGEQNMASTDLTTSDISLFDAITTTRAMRYLKRDPIPDRVLWAILRAATMGPSAGNRQHWGWVVVRDPVVKNQIAAWYRAGFESNYGGRRKELEPTDASRDLTGPNFRGSEHLANHIAEAPVWVFGVLRDTAASSSPLAGASIYGAIQNLMLAARAFGVGSTLTTNYVRHEREVAHLLGLPQDARTFALLPLGYPARGRFTQPRRVPLEEVVHWEKWGGYRPGAEFGSTD